MKKWKIERRIVESYSSEAETREALDNLQDPFSVMVTEITCIEVKPND